DVFFKKGDYEAAVEAYKKSMKEHPFAESRYPNALYNTAEALFWRAEYKESLDTYLKFLRTYPSHEHGSYAMTRVGELLEILGADQALVMGALLESQFRFRGSEGAAVARVRMLSQKMKGMKEKELAKTLSEMREYIKTSKLPKMGE